MKCLAAWFIPLALTGCAAEAIRNPVPPRLIEKAHVSGLSAARFWFDEKLENPDQALRRLGLSRLSSTLSVNEGRPEVNYLALSGGADDGAYGAGLLVGWSQGGRRPTFDVVTGISAGALIAPFALTRRALLHLLLSCAPPCGPAMLVTHDPSLPLCPGSTLVLQNCRTCRRLH